MFRECRHIMPTGRHCKSPAMGNSAYCYHHDRLRRRWGAPPRPKAMKLPKFDSREAILAGLNDVMNAILTRKVDLRQGGRLLYGMQIAATNLRKASAPGKQKAGKEQNPPPSLPPPSVVL